MNNDLAAALSALEGRFYQLDALAAFVRADERVLVDGAWVRVVKVRTSRTLGLATLTLVDGSEISGELTTLKVRTSRPIGRRIHSSEIAGPATVMGGYVQLPDSARVDGKIRPMVRVKP